MRKPGSHPCFCNRFDAKTGACTHALARGFGLETCPQQAWCDVGATVHRELTIPKEHILLCGMALGYADLEAPENTLVTERAGVDDFTTWHR
jgi:nitroreductase